MRKMKAFLVSGLCALLAAVSVGTCDVQADHFKGADNWNVTFTPQAQMVSNFRTADLDEAVAGLQPGDDIVFTVHLGNDHSAKTNWHMSNKVLYSLEDRVRGASTDGGAYSYRLSYINPRGEENVLFDSDTVGGEENIRDAGEGLHEATNALDEYFYLDTLTTGQKGEVVLEVELEGETQGNMYQDTLADLQLTFAVELVTETPPTTPGNPPPTTTRIVKTGDENNLLPLYGAMAGSGLVILILAIVTVRRRKKEDEQ